MQNYYSPTYPYYQMHQQVPVHNEHDQRFFPFLLPFVAGLAIGPLLFNRPFYPPYPAPYPPAYPGLGGYPGYGAYPGLGGYPGYGAYPALPQLYAAQSTTENINIYTK